MGENIILSISLLCSGRSETTTKCLDSLKKIMDKVSSELIIVDTGCDEETRKVIEKYTDKIIDFDWCDDFSKARNAGLKEACGEWFMFIDDDEWFEEPSEIIEFFISGDYRRYESAMYRVRNYSNYVNKNDYSDSRASRMVHRTKDTRFIDAVHEYIYPFNRPLKMLKCHAEHYGYAYKTRKERYEHAKRNIEILNNIIKKDSQNGRAWMHLVQEYVVINEAQVLRNVCSDGLHTLKDDKYNQYKTIGTLYAGLMIADKAMYRYDQVLQDYEKAMKNVQIFDMCKAKYTYYAAESLYYMEKYEEAIDLYAKYLSYYKQLGDDEEIIIQQGCFFTEDAFEGCIKGNVYCHIIMAGLKTSNLEYLKKYSDCLEWKSQEIFLVKEFIPELTDYMLQNEYDEFFEHVVELFLNRPSIDTDFLSRIKSKLSEASNDESDEIIRKVGRIIYNQTSENYYFYYLRIKYALLEGKTDYLIDDYEKLFTKVIDILSISDDVWRGAIDNNIDIQHIILDMSYEKWKNGVNSFCEKSNLIDITQKSEIVKAVKTTDNIRYDYFFTKSMEASIVYGKERDNFIGLRAVLREYADASLSFYNYFFKPIAFEGDMDMLPPSCRLAVKFDKAMKADDEGDPRECLRRLKDCIGVFTSLDGAIKTFADYYAEDAKEKLNHLSPNAEVSNCAKKYSKEMLELGEAVKKKIIELKEQGLTEEAKASLAQLKLLLPADDEIDAMEKMLSE